MSSINYNKLADLGIKLGGKTAGQIKTFCPKCHASRRNRTDRSLSVNITTGEYRCHSTTCEWKGNVREYDSKKEFKKLEPGFIPKDSKPGEKMIGYFKSRGISAETVEHFMVYEKVDWIPAENANVTCVCFPYFRDADLVNVKYRSAKKNFKLVKEAELIFYNLNSIRGKRKCIIVEGEPDALAAYEAGFSNQVHDRALDEIIDRAKAKKAKELAAENEEATKKKKVAPNDLKNELDDIDADLDGLDHLKFMAGWGVLSVPNGANKGGQSLDYLENCADQLLGIEEFVIATDNDLPGSNLRDELIRRLGAEKCRFVKWKDLAYVNKDGVRKPCKDLNDVLLHHGIEEVQNLIRDAETIRIDGIYYVDDLIDEMNFNFDNGVKMGESTRFPTFDVYFRWKKGEVNLWTGYGNQGKTTWVIQLMLAKSIYDGWRWAVFCPENYPPSDFFDDMAEMYVGKSINKNFEGHMTKEEYNEALRFINDHFFFIYPENEHDLMTIHDKFRYLVLKKGIDGCLIDPWNQLDTQMGKFQREDQYLSESFTKVKRFALANHVSYNIIAHPKSPNRVSGETRLPVPDAYDVAGGAMWANKMDNITTYYRPDWHENKDSPRVEIHTQKCKRKRTGGKLGMVEFTMVWKIKRFSDEWQRMPCDPIYAKQVKVDEEFALRNMNVGATEWQSTTTVPPTTQSAKDLYNTFTGDINDGDPLPF